MSHTNRPDNPAGHALDRQGTLAMVQEISRAFADPVNLYLAELVELTRKPSPVIPVASERMVSFTVTLPADGSVVQLVAPSLDRLRVTLVPFCQGATDSFVVIGGPNIENQKLRVTLPAVGMVLPAPDLLTGTKPKQPYLFATYDGLWASAANGTESVTVAAEYR